MFLETSGSYPASKGYISYLAHPVRVGYKSMCAFRYDMHGATMGAFKVDALVGSKWTTIFKEEGQANFKNQTTAFRLAQARLPAPSQRPCATYGCLPRARVCL